MAVHDLACQPWQSLASASRIPALTGRSTITAAELAVLVLAGVVAACAEAWLHWHLRGVPGHAIFKAVLPMIVGFAFVPRHGSGTVMGASAGMSAFVIARVLGGNIQPAATISMLLIGPSLDLALAGTEWTRWMYIRFALAGAFANLTALAVKVFGSLFGLALMGRPLADFLPRALPSFFLCGTAAGLFGAIILFRNRPVQRDDSPPETSFHEIA